MWNFWRSQRDASTRSDVSPKLIDSPSFCFPSQPLGIERLLVELKVAALYDHGELPERHSVLRSQGDS